MKRHLNKIIFIKSADIDYQEISLNGNVHFTGDQGVGKSTVLRAILFFYNARTDKLGINPGDENFLDFYFQFSNSYIIYEVQTEHNRFMVWLSKENNRPAYRFADAEYTKDLFFENTLKGIRPMLVNEIREKMAERQMTVSRKIFQFNEFKDIIYGANKETKFRPYNLLQSTAYQNVPNTISNIFLNAQLDSDKIKQTIIHSLVGEEQNHNRKKYQIDLQTVRKEIKEFEQDFNDISDFDKTKLKAEKIIELSNSFKQKEHEKLRAAENLGESVLYFNQHKLEIDADFKNLSEQLQSSIDTLKTTKTAHNESEKRINDEIVILDNDIKKAEKKKEYWKNIKINDNLIGIENILLETGKEEKLQTEKNAKDDELRTLKTEFESIDQKYKIRFQQVENEKETTINISNKKFSEFRNEIVEKKQKLNDYFEQKQDEITVIFEKNTDFLNRQKEQTQNTLSELKRKRERIQNQDFYKPEIEKLQSQVSEYQQTIIGNAHQTEIEKNTIKSIRDNAETEKKLMQQAYENQRKEVVVEYEKTKSETEKIDTDLQSYENSFYKFLHSNYAGWEETIAKVCDEKILFADNLRPKLTDKNNTLYGVDLDLSDTEKSVKTIQEYEADKQQLEKELQVLKNKITEIDAKFEADKSNFVKNRNKKIAALTKQIKVFEADNFELTNLKDKAELNISDFRQKAKEEKLKQLSDLHPKISNTEKQVREIDNKIAEQKTIRENQKTKLRDEKSQKTVGLNNLLKEQDIVRDENIKKAQKKYTVQKQKTENDQLEELAGKGADTEKIKEIAGEIAKLEKKLSFISDLNKKYLAKYTIEKEEIAKLPEYTEQKQKQEEQLNDLKIKQKEEIRKLSEVHDELQKDFTKTEKAIEAVEADLEKYERFSESEIYKELEYYITKSDAAQNNGKLENIIEALKNLIIDTSELSKKLKRQADEFVSPFRDDNIFNFRKKFIEDSDYLDFADNLKEYIEEEKIEDVKQQVKKKHAGLIEHIVGNIDLLASKRKDIDRTIADINKDFKNSNFVSVIQEFEMETIDTANAIVQVLFEIKNFHDNNPFDFGNEPNLFSGQKMEENNQKSVKLITALLKNLNTNSKQQEINLEDIFELKFRAKQNDKSTGWKSKLSDVGSHGTDILLKAMIYIMLLNVFKEKAVKKSKSKNFVLHCIMDEIGRIHSKNIKGLIEFAGSRDIWVIFGSPEENDALAYKYVYNFEKQGSITTATRLIYDKRK